jgi:hypothetical protein
MVVLSIFDVALRKAPVPLGVLQQKYAAVIQ